MYESSRMISSYRSCSSEE